jgi:TolB-like protein/Tfp pilus assembly protein PilF
MVEKGGSPGCRLFSIPASIGIAVTMSFIKELKRRNVFRAAIAYLVVAWLLMQIGDTLGPALLLPKWATSLLAFFLILGFPLAIFFAWTYEMTPDGLKPEQSAVRSEQNVRASGRGFDFLVIGLLSVALAYFAYDKFFAQRPDVPASETEITANANRHSIAVLPFVNMSADPDQEFFSDGLSEELLHLLAQIPELRVTSRSSAFSFKDKTFTIEDVGQALDVEYVLEGSVRKSNDQIRITAQLIEVGDDAHIWSQTWDRDLEDIFAVQDQIADAVATALEIQLVDKLPRAYVTDPEAYALYLRALELVANGSLSDLQQADALLRQVLEIDAKYGPALIVLGSITIGQAGYFAQSSMEESFEVARQFAQRAIDANPDFSDAYAALAYIAMAFDRDTEAARFYVNEALSNDPNSREAQRRDALLSRLNGNTEKFLRLAQEGIRINPLSAMAFSQLGTALMNARRYDESIQSYRRALEINPELSYAHTQIGTILFLTGKYEAAQVEFEAEPFPALRDYGQALINHALGKSADSDAALERLSMHIEAAAQIAEVHALRGDLDSAIEWLHRAFDHYDLGIMSAAVNPLLDNLREDPRFDEFLEMLRSGRE